MYVLDINRNEKTFWYLSSEKNKTKKRLTSKGAKSD